MSYFVKLKPLDKCKVPSASGLTLDDTGQMLPLFGTTIEIKYLPIHNKNARNCILTDNFARKHNLNLGFYFSIEWLDTATIFKYKLVKELERYYEKYNHS